MAVAARNGVCRGPVLRRRGMILGWRNLMHGWSHRDAHLAHVETRFATAGRGLAPSDSRLVAPRRPFVAAAAWCCRTATSRGRSVARWMSHCDTVVSHCGEPDI